MELLGFTAPALLTNPPPSEDLLALDATLLLEWALVAVLLRDSTDKLAGSFAFRLSPLEVTGERLAPPGRAVTLLLWFDWTVLAEVTDPLFFAETVGDELGDDTLLTDAIELDGDGFALLLLLLPGLAVVGLGEPLELLDIPDIDVTANRAAAAELTLEAELWLPDRPMAARI